MAKVDIHKLLKKKKAQPRESAKSKLSELFGVDDLDYKTVFIPEDKEVIKCIKCKKAIHLEEIDKYFFNDIKINLVGCCKKCETMYLVEGEKDAI